MKGAGESWVTRVISPFIMIYRPWKIYQIYAFPIFHENKASNEQLLDIFIT